MLQQNLQIAYQNETLGEGIVYMLKPNLRIAYRNETLSTKRDSIDIATKFTDSTPK